MEQVEDAMKFQFETIHMKDIVALVVLVGGFVLIAMGKDSFIAAITAAVVGYYFSKRVYEENGNKTHRPQDTKK